MPGLRLLGVLLGDAFKDLLRHRGQHILAVLTLASGLLLAGGGLLFVESLDRLALRLEGLAKITLWAEPGGSLQEAEARLHRDPRFSEVRRVSAGDNVKRFKETTREAGLLLDSVGEDALPESLELTLRPDLRAAGRAMEVGESLRGEPGVADVLVDQERLEGLQKTARLVRQALGALGLVLLLAAGFSTGNVIRMSILAREEEIAIMRLVGAGEGFIRTPLLLVGALLGLLGSALAVGGLYGLWLPLSRGYLSLPPLLVELARLGFFSLRSLLLLAAVGATTGALGALWGFRATQKAQREAEALLDEAR